MMYRPSEWAKGLLQKWRDSAEAPDGDGDIEWDYLALMLDAARKEAIEEAVQVALAYEAPITAHAIRALIDKPPAPPPDPNDPSQWP